NYRCQNNFKPQTPKQKSSIHTPNKRVSSMEPAASILTMVSRLDSSTVEFIHTSKFNTVSEGAKDLEAKVDWKELCSIAKTLGCVVSKDKVHAKSQSDYDKLLIFAAVRSTLKCKTAVSELSEVVLKLNGYDLNYWALQFKRAFWYEDHSQVTRVAKAFTVLFGLVSP
ncbi:MAG: hypothetical protein ACUVTB_06780, partial [Candidatus Bathycorpusculaceae bacterium]